jgi:hypothetical protein
MAARLGPLEPVLRALLTVVWLAGGLVPLFLTPMAQSTHLLSRLGLNGMAQVGAVWTGSLADVAVGLALILRRRGRPLQAWR